MSANEVRTVRLCRIKPSAEPEFVELPADRHIWDSAFERSLMPAHVNLYGMGQLFPELVAGTDAYVNDNGIAEGDKPNRLASLLAGQRIYGTMVIFGPYDHAAELDADGNEVDDAFAGMSSLPPEVEEALTPTEHMTVIQRG